MNGIFCVEGQWHRNLTDRSSVLPTWVTDRSSVELDTVADILEDSCAGRMLYFSSCSVMRSTETLARFMKVTGAAMLCGFTKSVDWIEAAAFELTLLDCLVNGERIDSAQRTLRSRRWAPLAEHLGFRIVYPDGRVA